MITSSEAQVRLWFSNLASYAMDASHGVAELTAAGAGQRFEQFNGAIDAMLLNDATDFKINLFRASHSDSSSRRRRK
jgi:hypothetical protein